MGFWGALGGPFGAFAGLRGHPEFPKLSMFAPLNPYVFAGTILAPKPDIFRNRVFTFVKLMFLNVRERKPIILKKLLKLDTFFAVPFSCYIYGFLLDPFRRRIPKRCFPCLGASRCRFRAPKRTLPPSKTFILRQ